jgi:hypothetical protein
LGDRGVSSHASRHRDPQPAALEVVEKLIEDAADPESESAEADPGGPAS